MKKVFIYILASILLYSFFRELNAVKVMFISLGLASIYVIYRIPSKYIIATKYPIILLSFAATAGYADDDQFFRWPAMVIISHNSQCLVVIIDQYFGGVFS